MCDPVLFRRQFSFLLFKLGIAPEVRFKQFIFKDSRPSGFTVSVKSHPKVTRYGPTLGSHPSVPPQCLTLGFHLRAPPQGPTLGPHLRVSGRVLSYGPGSNFSGVPSRWPKFCRSSIYVITLLQDLVLALFKICSIFLTKLPLITRVKNA